MTLTLHFFVAILQESDLIENLWLKNKKQSKRKSKTQHISAQFLRANEI